MLEMRQYFCIFYLNSPRLSEIFSHFLFSDTLYNRLILIIFQHQFKVIRGNKMRKNKTYTYTIKKIIVNNKIYVYIRELVNYIFLNKLDLCFDVIKMTTIELLDFIKENSPNDFMKFQEIIYDYEDYCDCECLESEEKIEYPMYTLCMHPSRMCNLKCKYCFSNDNDNLPKREISIDMAKRAVDFMVTDWGKDARKYTIDIAGSGEPILKLDFIKELCDYCKEIQNRIDKQIKIMFPTNGTLVTRDIAEYFEKENSILLGFSIDGNEVQNINRIKQNGDMAFNDCIRGMKLIKNRKFGIATTITHANEDVDEIYDYFVKNFKNADAISMQVVRDYGCSDISFYNINVQNLIWHYQKLVKRILNNFEHGNFEYIRPLLIGADNFGSYFLRVLCKGKQNHYRCSGGRATIAIDDKGKIYSCSVGNSDCNYEIGDIYKGIDKEKAKIFSYPTTEHNPDCKNCWAAYICGGECFVTAKLSRDNFYLSNQAVCAYRKSLVELSVFLAQTIKDNYPDAYRYVIDILKERNFFESVTDSSIWAINYYLKAIGVIIKKHSIISKLGDSRIGVSPQKINEVICTYKNSFSFYEISETKYLNRIKFPAIVMLNKLDSMFYEYAIIEKIEREKIILKTNFSDKLIEIGCQEFLDKYSDILGF